MQKNTYGNRVTVDKSNLNFFSNIVCRNTMYFLISRVGTNVNF